MQFYRLETLGDVNNIQLCVLDDLPDGMGMKDYYLSVGKAAQDYFPDCATVSMDKEQLGTKVPDFVGNTHRCLIASQRLHDIICEFCPSENIEYLKFVLLDHQYQPYPESLYFINPIGYYDCLDISACGVVYKKNGRPRRVERIILDIDKIKSAPALFRIPESRDSYIIREDLLDAFTSASISNVVTEPLPQNN